MNGGLKTIIIFINYGEVKILIKRIYILTNTQADFSVVRRELIEMCTKSGLTQIKLFFLSLISRSLLASNRHNKQ